MVRNVLSLSPVAATIREVFSPRAYLSSTSSFFSIVRVFLDFLGALSCEVEVEGRLDAMVRRDKLLCASVRQALMLVGERGRVAVTGGRLVGGGATLVPPNSNALNRNYRII